MLFLRAPQSACLLIGTHGGNNPSQGKAHLKHQRNLLESRFPGFIQDAFLVDSLSLYGVKELKSKLLDLAKSRVGSFYLCLCSLLRVVIYKKCFFFFFFSMFPKHNCFNFLCCCFFFFNTHSLLLSHQVLAVPCILGTIQVELRTVCEEKKKDSVPPLISIDEAMKQIRKKKQKN